MDSGMKIAVTNTRERAVSTDLNRMQAFAGRGLAELLRYLLNASLSTDDLDAGAIMGETVAQGTPLSSEVINGLLVQVQPGSLSLSITNGLLLCVDPLTPFNVDDSPYKYVADPGVVLADGLAMQPNTDPVGTRIDVIECQRVVIASESDNRDIFDQPTGTFNATTVTKATESRLVYNIRRGGPGGGFPGLAKGWLPLAVASVPPLATSNDQITFWDVRPMLSDRAFGLMKTNLAAARRLLCRIDAVNVLGAVHGLSDHIFQGRRVGGRLRRGTPGTDAQSIDLNDHANWSPNMAAAAPGSLAYLYLCTPFGLPRWARYTDAGVAGFRVPRSPRGIPVMSPAAPDESGNGTVLLPASLGFASSSEVGVAIATTTFDGTSMLSFADSGHSASVAGGTGSVVATVTPPNIASCVFTAGVHYPPNARELLVAVSVNLPVATPPLVVVGTTQVKANGDVAFSFPDTFGIVSAGETGFIYGRAYWLPIAPSYPNAPSTLQIDHVVNDLADTISSAAMAILGWRY